MTTATKKKELTIPVQVTNNVSIHEIADLLCGAFEGGSNYWYLIEEKIKPLNLDNSEEGQNTWDTCFPHMDYPINEGGALIISDINEEDDEDREKWTLDLNAIKEGIQLMATDYPVRFNEFITGNYDAETSDVFLQLCLFKDVIFG